MKKIIFTILTIIWMSIIFLLSNQKAVASTKVSNSFIDRTIINIYETFKGDVGEDEKLSIKEKFSLPVRKLAHFTVYFILGILILCTLNEYRVDSKSIVYYAILLCFIYACTDEIHQLFVLGRSGEFKDVVLDTVGSIIGILLLKGKVVK